MQSLGRRFVFTRISRFRIVKYKMSSSVPQIHPFADAGSGIPVNKKARLDEGDTASQMEMENDAMVDEGVVMQEDGSKQGVSTKKTQTNAKKKKKKKDPPLPEPYSPADILYREIRMLLGGDVVDDVTKSGKAFSSPYLRGETLDVKVEMLGAGGKSVTVIATSFVEFNETTCIGHGIALAPKEKGPWAIVVPCTLPGEMVRVRVGRWERMHSCAQLLEVIHPNIALRDDSRIKCRYFGTCGGCQYQVSGLHSKCCHEAS
jgi:tRNA (uracil-5-)-methyltransferase